jgi:ATP-binding cassette subfamily F protein uup
VRSRTKLTYKEARELEALPGRIEALEAEQSALTAKMNDPEYHRVGGAAMKADHARSVELEALLHSHMERWEQLETKARAAPGTG